MDKPDQSRAPVAAGADYNPRHRIMGAILLVALAVIFLPMILESPENGPTGTPPMEIPEKQHKVFISKITPVQPEASGAGTAAEPSASATQTVPVPEPAPAGGEPKPKPESTPAASKPEPVASTPAEPPAASGAADSDAWLVRIGTFSKMENARRIMSLLRQKGFGPKSGEVHTGGQSATRVWVGPFATRDEAITVRARILKETGEEGLIVADQ
ncbi:MAG: SPOR domain-containing protein [Gammaproteobacteria bacterium]|jgi:DedD protein|nr:SPOR domain-containing protein [Gammaproteobacteria bacterium]